MLLLHTSGRDISKTRDGHKNVSFRLTQIMDQNKDMCRACKAGRLHSIFKKCLCSFLPTFSTLGTGQKERLNSSKGKYKPKESNDFAFYFRGIGSTPLSIFAPTSSKPIL